MLGLESGPYLSTDTHWINLMMLNQPGLLARVLCVIGHHNANIENARVDRFDGGDRSRAILRVTMPEPLLNRVERKLSRIIGVLSVETVSSPLSPSDNESVGPGDSIPDH